MNEIMLRLMRFSFSLNFVNNNGNNHLSFEQNCVRLFIIVMSIDLLLVINY